MKRNIILLLILSILAVQIPAFTVSADDASDTREALAMAMRIINSGSRKTINEAVYENNSRSGLKGGNGVEDGVQCHYSYINYSDIADGNDWVGIRMRLRDDGYRDFSEIKENAKAVYKVKLGQDADVNNLYFTVSSKNGAVAGVSADLSADKDGNNIPDVKEAWQEYIIPLSTFDTEGVEMNTGLEFNAAEFTGIGMVRKNDASGTNPASDDKIWIAKLNVMNLPAVSDLEASAHGGIELSFTKPTAPTIDFYELVRTAPDNSETVTTLTADDFILNSGKYVYTDKTPEADITYTYKIRIHESEYGLYSLYSNEVTGMMTDEDSGEEIPLDGDSTVAFDMETRGFRWQADPPSIPEKMGGAGLDYGVNASSIPDMGAGTINKYDMNPNRFAEKDTYEDPTVPYRGYMVATHYTSKKNGGESEDIKNSKNIASYKDSGYAVYRINIDEAVPLDNLYFTMASAYADGSTIDASRTFIGLPVTDYITDADKGKTMYVSIPLKDFTISNPHAFQSLWNNKWSGRDADVEKEIDWTLFSSMGFLRRVYDGNNGNSDPKIETPEYVSGYIYEGDMFIANVEPPKNFSVYDVKADKIVLKWDHTNSDAVKYNIYRTENGENRTLLGECTKNVYVDSFGETGMAAGTTYKYEIEAVDKYGAKSPILSDETTIRTIDRPRNFQTSAYTSNTAELAVNISWSEPKYGDLAGYVLYRNGEVYQRLDPSVTSYKDTALTEHSEYTYTMTAVDTNGKESIHTNPVTVIASAVAVPTGLTYEVKNSNQTELAYNAPEFAEKYYIYLNGEKIAETTETVYTVTDVPYDTALVFGVRAVNAAGATSNETKTEEFVIKNPQIESALILFDDTLNADYTKEISSGGKISETTDKAILGRKSLCLDFAERKAGVISATLSAKKIDIKDYRDNGGRLGFWLFAEEGADLAKMQVGVGTTTSLSGKTVPLRAMVDIKDYASAYGKWVYVEIPLTDFADIGEAVATGKIQSAPIDYANFKNFVITYDTSRVTSGPKIYLDQITIDEGKSWTVRKIEDENRNSSPVSAAAKKINITFSEDMLPETLTAEGIKLGYTADGEDKYVNYYGTYSDKVFTLNLLEPLTANTAYTLSISGARTTEKKSGTFTETVYTNNDTPSAPSYTLPDIKPVITTSKNGSVTTVTIAMPESAKDMVKGYTINVGYNSTYIKPNGNNAVTGTPSDATVTKADNKITISGNKNGSVLSGTLAEIKFATANAGTTKVTVTGTANVYNSAAEKENPASISAEKEFSVTKNDGMGSNGQVGGNVSNSADRDKSTVPKDNIPPVNDFDEPTKTTEKFSDINECLWAKDAIEKLAEEGYINGYDDGTYKPNNSVTREEFTKMLMSLLGYHETEEEAKVVLSDIDENAWYAKFLIMALNRGIVNGMDDNTFGVGRTITRQDMCVMLSRALKARDITIKNKYDKVKFSDPISDYAEEAVVELQRYGLVNGVGDNLFDAYGNVTRAMAAKVLYELDKVM